MRIYRVGKAAERAVGDHLLIFPLARSTAEVGHIFSLEGVGAFVWNELNNPQLLDDLVEAVLRSFDVQREVARRDVQTFVADLQEAGLIRVEEQTA